MTNSSQQAQSEQKAAVTGAVIFEMIVFVIIPVVAAWFFGVI